MPCYKAQGYEALQEVRGLEEVSVYGILHSANYQVAAVYKCPSCADSTKGDVSNAEELVRAMKRPRLKSYCPDPDRDKDVLRPGSFRAGKYLENEELDDDYVYPTVHASISSHDSRFRPQ